MYPMVCAVCFSTVGHGVYATSSETSPRPTVVIPAVAGDVASCDGQWVGFSPDGQYVGLRSLQFIKPRSEPHEVLGLFDLGAKKMILRVEIEARMSIAPANCAFSSNSDWLAYIDTKAVRFLAIPARDVALPAGGSLPLKPPAIGRALTWTDITGDVYVYDVANGVYALKRIKLTAKERDSQVIVQGGKMGSVITAQDLNLVTKQFAIAVDPTRANEKPSLECCTLGTNPTKVTIPQPRQVYCIALSPNGTTVLAGYGDGSVACYDRRTGKTIKHWMPMCQFSVKAVAFHPSGRYFACGSLDGRGRPNLFLIDTTSGEILHKIIADPNGVTAVSFNRSGSRLAAFGGSGTVTIWDATKLLKLERD